MRCLFLVSKQKANDSKTLTCQEPYCDNRAVVAVHTLTDTSVLVRSDHLIEPFIEDWRCLDCAVGALERLFP